MAQRFFIVGDKKRKIFEEKGKIEMLVRENQETRAAMREIEDAKAVTEEKLRDSQKNCEFFKEIALRAENLHYEQGKIINELERVTMQNSELLRLNEELLNENSELIEAKSILQEEIERLNRIVYQIEGKLVEIMQESEKEAICKSEIWNSESFLRKQEEYSKSTRDFPLDLVGKEHTERKILSKTIKSKLQHKANRSLSEKTLDLQFSTSSPLSSPKKSWISEKPLNKNREKYLTKLQSLTQLKSLIRTTQETKQKLIKDKRF